MAWTYKSAAFHGNKANPQPGHNVVVTIQEASDPENVLEKQFTYTFDGKKTKAQFVTMVRQEIKAHIQALNANLSEENVTSEFDPT